MVHHTVIAILRLKAFLARHPLACIAAAILVAVSWYVSAYPRGMLAAWFDQARGHYEIQVLGYPGVVRPNNCSKRGMGWS